MAGTSSNLYLHVRFAVIGAKANHYLHVRFAVIGANTNCHLHVKFVYLCTHLNSGFRNRLLSSLGSVLRGKKKCVPVRWFLVPTCPELPTQGC